MSNPAVTTLCKTKVSNQPMWMDDNIGEAIHLHMGDTRVDLSNKEFEQIYDDICNIINDLVSVKGFDCHKINPVFMEDMLWRDVQHLTKVKIDYVKLEELLCPFYGKYIKLPNSRAVRALNGDTKDNDDNRRSHHINQTSKERLESLYESIRINGYPFNDEYIILYGDDYVIQDGQHRAACLWKLKGNIRIPVLRLYFDNYIDYDKLKRLKKTQLYYRHKVFKENTPNSKVFFRKLRYKTIQRASTLKRKTAMKRYMSKYGKYNDEFIKLYNQR